MEKTKEKNEETVKKHECEQEKKDKKNCKCQKKNEKIEKLQQELLEKDEKIKYAQAELINYRKRKDDEFASYKKYCNQDLISELIPILDNFERALNQGQNQSEEIKKYLTGFEMMKTSLWETLKKYGVEEINNEGKPFNSQEEEALMTDSKEDVDDDIVLEVLLKGYKLKDRVIRPASVKINKK